MDTYDILIVGAGPAGLTSALYALRANKKVLVLEALTYGGQIINASKIENYPAIEEISGVEFAEKLYKQVLRLGGEVRIETVTHIAKNKVVTTNKNKYKAKSIIIATGCKNKRLNIENEEKLLGRGISYCATCDGNFFKGKTVAVNGGGNTALEDAIYLADIAKKVYLIHRRDEFRGEEMLASAVKEKDNIECILNSTIVKINGDDKLESITIKDKNNQEDIISVDGLFIAIGQVPNNQAFLNVLDTNDYGYIVSIDGVHTKTAGIYVAGDAREKDLRQLTTAVSDGSIAAVTAIKEMKK